jgi:DNA-binding SARP family transcriptional activator
VTIDVPGPNDKICIWLMGAPRYAGSDAFFPAKAFALVAGLLMSPGSTLSRSVAASLLWENVDQKRALGNLRQLLSKLQNFADGEELIQSKNGNLIAGPKAFRSDLAQFITTIRTADPASRLEAMLLFRGELLHGHETAQEQFYLWLLAERSRLKDLFFAALGPLLEDLTRFGRQKANEIGTLADRALALEEEREQTYRDIMAAYARVGDTGAAQRTYDRLLAVLQREGRSPDQATIALYRRLNAHATAASGDNEKHPLRRSQPRVAFTLPVAIDRTPAAVVIQSFAEDVANGLARYRTFRILSPTSSYAMSARGALPSDDRIRADYLVNTTIVEHGHASITLVETKTDEIIWSLDLALDDQRLLQAFRILSRQVVSALAETLERHQMESIMPREPSAYLHLLSGQHLLKGECDLPLIRKARGEFRKAIDLEPGMAVARGRIAQTLQLEWLMLGGSDPHLLHRAKAEAEASVEIDAASGIGQWMSAVVALYQRDFDTSAEQFMEAEALAPNSADLLLQHADALAHFGQTDQAWDRFQRAIDLNPFAPDIYWWAGASIAYKREEYQTAIDLCANMRNDESTLRLLTVCHALLGNAEDASEYARRLQEIYPGMTARQFSLVSPNKDPRVNEKLFEAFRLAGIP